jgi:hypothetical protein
MVIYGAYIRFWPTLLISLPPTGFTAAFFYAAEILSGEDARLKSLQENGYAYRCASCILCKHGFPRLKPSGSHFRPLAVSAEGVRQ